MAQIDDFGEHLSGAAKERWQSYRTGLSSLVSDKAGILAEPLSKSFPEPPYDKLIEDGVDPWVLSFVRAARDMIPVKPRQGYKLNRWASQVETLRRFSSNVIGGIIDREAMLEALSDPKNSGFSRQIHARLDLYMALSHGKSLKGFELQHSKYSFYDGERRDPPLRLWEVVRSGTGSIMKVVSSSPDKDETIDKFRDFISVESGVSLKKPVKFDIYTYRGSPDKGCFIAKKAGKDLITLETFQTVSEARRYLRENQTALEEKLEMLKDLPPERGERNRERLGFERRSKDVTPEEFMNAFGFRGVQFGNYVEGVRRQQDLNKAYDALMDLADVVGCPPAALSLRGSLGLAFGARGRGGKGAAAAHFEPDGIIINLTKTNGAGSLAHEWFHALDNHLSRVSGGRETAYASDHPHAHGSDPRSALVRLKEDIKSGTDIFKRSSELDKTRSTPYYGTNIEVTARSFEAYVIDQLAHRGVENDYLANITCERVFEAISEMRGQPAGRYPYPLEAELTAIGAAYGKMLSDPEIRRILDTPEVRADPERSRTIATSGRDAPVEQEMKKGETAPPPDLDDDDDPENWGEISFQ